jgi:beta-lactam-binding protein with PASTA domain
MSTGIVVPVIRVPRVTGMGQADASRCLLECGLSYQVLREPSTVAPRGWVIAMSPPSGVSVDAGTQVKITVSDGPPFAAQR